jgi:hypothetical protein
LLFFCFPNNLHQHYSWCLAISCLQQQLSWKNGMVSQSWLIFKLFYVWEILHIISNELKVAIAIQEYYDNRFVSSVARGQLLLIFLSSLLFSPCVLHIVCQNSRASTERMLMRSHHPPQRWTFQGLFASNRQWKKH